MVGRYGYINRHVDEPPVQRHRTWHDVHQSTFRRTRVSNSITRFLLWFFKFGEFCQPPDPKPGLKLWCANKLMLIASLCYIHLENGGYCQAVSEGWQIHTKAKTWNQGRLVQGGRTRVANTVRESVRRQVKNCTPDTSHWCRKRSAKV